MGRSFFLRELLLQFLQFFFGLRMIGMLFEELQKNGLGLLPVAFDGIDARQIQIGLVVRGRYANRLFKTAFRFLRALCTQVENPKVVECFRIRRSGS